ncbi:MAG: hypothetical protein IKP65_04930 [Alphaproteobacteria bacterium]|nr:hypothetical protein [Alphaproteobacteria bacterium]
MTDKYGNITNVSLCNIYIYQQIPKNLSLKLTGSDGNNNYTGFYKRYNRFFPSEFINVNFSAESEIKLYYKLSGNVTNNGEEWMPMN